MAKSANTSLTGNWLLELQRKPLWVVLLITTLVYANTLFNGYNLDDELVTRNHRLTSQGISAIPEIFNEPYYKDEMGYAYEYRPVVLISYAVEHSLFGENPFTGHLINFLLYILLIYILYKSLQELFPALNHNILSALLLIFSLHPSHTEVVASLKSRDEILSMLFAAITYLYSLKQLKNASISQFILISVSLFLSLLSKQSAVAIIPITILSSLILSNVNFKGMLWVCLALIAPALITIQLPLYTKLLLGLSMLFLTIGVYVIFSFNISHYLRLGTNRLLTLKASDTYRSKLNTAYNNPLAVYDYFLIAGNFGVSLLILYYSNTLLIYSCSFALIFFSTLLYIKRNNISLLISYAIHLLLTFVLGHDVYGVHVSLLVYSITFSFFWQHQNVSRFLIIALGFIAGITIYIYNGNLDWFLLFVAVLSIYKKINIGIYIYILHIVISHFIDLSNIYSLDAPDVSIRIFVEILLLTFKLVLLWGFAKNKKRIFAIILFSAAAFYSLSALYLYVSNQKYLLQKSYVTTQKVVVQSIDSNLPTILPKTFNRPLNFMETPVTHESPNNIRIGTAATVLFKYLKLTIVPYPMAFYYGYAEIKPEHISNPIAILSIIIHLLLGIVAIYFIRSEPLLSFGLFWYLISIAMYSTYFVAIPGMFGDRYLFIPTFGFAMVVGWIVLKLSKQTPETFDFLKLQKPLKYAVLGLLLVYSTITIARNFQWKNHLTLMEHDIEYVDQSAQAHNLLALHLVKYSMDETDAAKQTEMRKKAIYHFQRSQEIYPDFFNTHYDEGRVHVMLGQYDSALLAFKDAIRIDSTFGEAPKTIGDIYFEKQDFASAIPYYQKVIALMPGEYYAYEKVSYMYFMLKNYEQSIATNRLAARNLPALPDPYINIARTYVGMNRLDSATYYLQAALQVSPNNPGIQQMIQQLNQMQIQSGKSGR